jgi:Rrf2 family protein
MHISKKSEYALRALLSIARRQGGGPVQITELSERDRIPVKFLEQILLTLRKAEILASKRGVGGGYTLNRAPDKISVGEIIRLMDGPILPVSEDIDPRGPLRVYLVRLQSEVAALLDGQSLADIAALGGEDGSLFFEI